MNAILFSMEDPLDQQLLVLAQKFHNYEENINNEKKRIYASLSTYYMNGMNFSQADEKESTDTRLTKKQKKKRSNSLIQETKEDAMLARLKNEYRIQLSNLKKYKKPTITILFPYADTEWSELLVKKKKEYYLKCMDPACLSRYSCHITTDPEKMQRSIVNSKIRMKMHVLKEHCINQFTRNPDIILDQCTFMNPQRNSFKINQHTMYKCSVKDCLAKQEEFKGAGILSHLASHAHFIKNEE